MTVVHLEPEEEVRLRDLFASVAKSTSGLGLKLGQTLIEGSVEAMGQIGKSAFQVFKNQFLPLLCRCYLLMCSLLFSVSPSSLGDWQRPDSQGSPGEAARR